MTNQYEMTDKLGFEIRTCTRCGGTGRHSFNQVNRDTCFGCSGTGKQYTARGKAAKVFYENSLSTQMSEIKVGDLLQVEGCGRRYFGTVVEIREDNGCKTLKDGVWVDVPMLVATTEHEKYGRGGLGTHPHTPVRKGWSAEEKAPKIAAALAYQDSLTKAGKVRKGKAS